MITDFKFNQADLLKPSKLADPALYGGICFAMVVDWCTKVKSGQNVVPGADFYRQTSSQRAYQMTWEDRIKDHMNAASYGQFYAAAEGPSYKFFSQGMSHSGWGCTRLEYSSVQEAKQGMKGVGSVALIGLFGSENGSNWGHAVAMGRAGRWSFFDPNQGQFSLPGNAAGEVFAEEVMVNINTLYATTTVKNCVLYVVG